MSDDGRVCVDAIKWTWLHEKVDGPLAFEADYHKVSGLVTLPEDCDDWHIQVWHRCDLDKSFATDRDCRGFDTAAEAKREAETYIRRFASDDAQP